ncbi:hypothetical protein TPAR_04590, partial [Tolypocladium paradoxum]
LANWASALGRLTDAACARPDALCARRIREQDPGEGSDLMSAAAIAPPGPSTRRMFWGRVVPHEPWPTYHGAAAPAAYEARHIPGPGTKICRPSRLMPLATAVADNLLPFGVSAWIRNVSTQMAVSFNRPPPLSVAGNVSQLGASDAVPRDRELVATEPESDPDDSGCVEPTPAQASSVQMIRKAGPRSGAPSAIWRL